MALSRKELLSYLNEYLKTEEFLDYGPNGLQVEGSKSINKIAFSVSATADSIQRAAQLEAEALIVHHGIFWKFHGARTLTGPFFKRVSPLIKNNMNLIGYHLPLDAHMEVGNAASLARLLDLNQLKPFGDYKGSPIGVYGQLKSPADTDELHRLLEKTLGHQVYHAKPEGLKSISTMGIITGGANGQWTRGLKLGS